MGVNLAPPGHPDQFAVVDHTPAVWSCLPWVSRMMKVLLLGLIAPGRLLACESGQVI